MSARFAGLGAALLLWGPSAANAQSDDAWAEAEDPPLYDDARVAADPGFKFELRAGLAMPEQASRLRITNPTLSAGFSLRPHPRLRLDGGYGFTWVNQGTEAVAVVNTHHSLNARAHWLLPAGPAWFSVGAGPVLHLVTVSGPGDAGLALSPGIALAGGAETFVGTRLFRIEAGMQSRGRRLDLLMLTTVGF